MDKVRDGKEAMQPDVAVLDCQLPGMSGPQVAVGQWVNKSVIIAFSGQSGGVAPHLHFEVRDSNNNDSPVVIRDLSGITWNSDNCTGSATYY
ncbi:MAG: hypothetical protein SVX38_04330 [Chloroflexota bacterium]|nr:hypothetical protein [Chloroflexota bacterium]